MIECARSPSPPHTATPATTTRDDADPGMPEVGNFPLPKKVLRTGVTDMVREGDVVVLGDLVIGAEALGEAERPAEAVPD